MQGNRGGQGAGQGGGRRRKGQYGMGPGGACVCPKCGHKEQHQIGVPCYDRTCPKCNTPLARDK